MPNEPRTMRTHLNGWAIAREAAAQFGLDWSAEMNLRTQLERTQIVLRVDKRGNVEVVGYAKLP